jgi:hypothetical protein
MDEVLALARTRQVPALRAQVNAPPGIGLVFAILRVSEYMFYAWLGSAFVIGAMLALASVWGGLAAVNGLRTAAERRARIVIAVIDFGYVLWDLALGITFRFGI